MPNLDAPQFLGPRILVPQSNNEALVMAGIPSFLERKSFLKSTDLKTLQSRLGFSRAGALKME